MSEQSSPQSEPHVAQAGPYQVELEAGKTYYWCHCGESKSQPFCDTTHTQTEFQPKAFTVEETKSYYLCGCKRTGTAPFCDTSHELLEG